MKRITLRRARQRAGLSQLALARAAGMDQSAISKLELAKVADPSFSVGLKLAKALGIDPRVLKFGAADAPATESDQVAVAS